MVVLSIIYGLEVESDSLSPLGEARDDCSSKKDGRGLVFPCMTVHAVLILYALILFVVGSFDRYTYTPLSTISTKLTAV